MSGKFEQIIENYQKYLTEAGFPALSNVQKPNITGSTATPAASGTDPIDDKINTDPSVINAKKQALQKTELDLKKRANTITNP